MKGLLLFLCLASSLNAGIGVSISYSNLDNVDAGGRRSATANYVNDGSFGGITGMASVTAPAESIRSGYIAQLYEVTGLVVTVSSTNLNEATSQMFPVRESLDDGTVNTTTTWTGLVGPITSVTSAGLVSVGNVYQDTPADLRAVADSFSQQINLMVKNIGSDDFGIYGSDGIDDAWQTQYFGTNNPLGMATADATGSGQNNFFKYTAGLNPTNPASVFSLNFGSTGGPTGYKQLVFSPRYTNRTYTVEYRNSVASGVFSNLTEATASDVGTIRTVTDTNASGPARFYRVKIAYP